MDDIWKPIVWQQFGAAIDTLENAIKACPEEIWGNSQNESEPWYLAYHTLFFLDYYLTDSSVEFAPPEPFTLSEMDPEGIFPDRAYTRDDLLTYLDHCWKKCRQTIYDLTDEKALETRRFPWGEIGGAELLLYNMRHVQHHAAQLNMLLRQKADIGSRWVFKELRMDN